MTGGYWYWLALAGPALVALAVAIGGILDCRATLRRLRRESRQRRADLAAALINWKRNSR